MTKKRRAKAAPAPVATSTDPGSRIQIYLGADGLRERMDQHDLPWSEIAREAICVAISRAEGADPLDLLKGSRAMLSRAIRELEAN